MIDRRTVGSQPPEVRVTIEDWIELVARLRRLRPGDESQLDRFYAIAIDDLERALSHFAFWTDVWYIAQGGDDDA